MPLRTLRPMAIAFAAYSAIAIALTFPLVLHLSSAVPHDTGDPILSTTILWWNAHVVDRKNQQPATQRNDIEHRVLTRWRSAVFLFRSANVARLRYRRSPGRDNGLNGWSEGIVKLFECALEPDRASGRENRDGPAGEDLSFHN
jgi:hypothetical protein